MAALARSLLVFAMIFCFVGCTTVRTVSDVPSMEMKKTFHKGNKIKVSTKDGEVRELIVTDLDEATLYGTEKDAPVKIPRDQINSVDIKTVSFLKTAGLGVAVWAALIALVVYNVKQELNDN